MHPDRRRTIRGPKRRRVTWLAGVAAAALMVPASIALAGQADFSGFWKYNCADPYGIQIKPYRDGLYTARFCGPGGCDAAPDAALATPIDGDRRYEVISADEIREKEGTLTIGVLHKCTTDTNPVLQYSAEDIAEGHRNLAMVVLFYIGYVIAAILAYRFLRPRLPGRTPFATRAARASLLALLFAPGVLVSFPFAAPTFALVALVMQLIAALRGDVLAWLPALAFTTIPVLLTWALILAVGTLLARFRRGREDVRDPNP